MKSRQPGNKIWSVNRIYHEKYLPENYINNNAGGEASPTPFQKIKIEHIISLDYQSVMLHSVFLLYVLVEVYQNIFKLQC